MFIYLFLEKQCVPQQYLRTLSKALPFMTACVCQGQVKEVTTSPTERALQRLVSTTPTPPPSMHFDSCHGARYSAPVSSFILHRCKANMEVRTQESGMVMEIDKCMAALCDVTKNGNSCRRNAGIVFSVCVCGWGVLFFFTVKLNCPFNFACLAFQMEI